MNRRGFSSVELLVTWSIVAVIVIVTLSSHPRQSPRLDDRFGLLPLGLVLLWGTAIALKHAKANILRTSFVLAAILAIVLPHFFRRWGMSVKVWLLESPIDPFYWEACLTFVMALPLTLAIGLLLASVYWPYLSGQDDNADGESIIKRT